jgi:hypothetical protein
MRRGGVVDGRKKKNIDLVIFYEIDISHSAVIGYMA